MTAVIHIAGPVVHIGQWMRQRCMWCGAVLCDYDLNRVMVPLPTDGSEPPSPATWEVGALIGVAGESPKATWVEMGAEEAWGCPDHEHKAEMPEGSCCRLDPAVTT